MKFQGQLWVNSSANAFWSQINKFFFCCCYFSLTQHPCIISYGNEEIQNCVRVFCLFVFFSFSDLYHHIREYHSLLKGRYAFRASKPPLPKTAIAPFPRQKGFAAPSGLFPRIKRQHGMSALYRLTYCSMFTFGHTGNRRFLHSHLIMMYVIFH